MKNSDFFYRFFTQRQIENFTVGCWKTANLQFWDDLVLIKNDGMRWFLMVMDGVNCLMFECLFLFKSVYTRSDFLGN